MVCFVNTVKCFALFWFISILLNRQQSKNSLIDYSFTCSCDTQAVTPPHPCSWCISLFRLFWSSPLKGKVLPLNAPHHSIISFWLPVFLWPTVREGEVSYRERMPWLRLPLTLSAPLLTPGLQFTPCMREVFSDLMGGNLSVTRCRWITMNIEHYQLGTKMWIWSAFPGSNCLAHFSQTLRVLLAGWWLKLVGIKWGICFFY